MFPPPPIPTPPDTLFPHTTLFRSIDATVLARLYASGFLPEVWVPDQQTMRLRRQVTRRNQVVRQRVRLKTMIQAILHAHLVPQCPHADIAGPKGRAWL